MRDAVSNARVVGRVIPGPAHFQEEKQPMDSVDKILTKYQLQRETAEAMIANSPCYNWVDLADEIDVSEDTIHNYKRAFKAMTEAERLRVIAVLSQDRFAEVVDDDR